MVSKVRGPFGKDRRKDLLVLPIILLKKIKKKGKSVDNNLFIIIISLLYGMYFILMETIEIISLVSDKISANK